jgi:hypothetical protein
LRIRLEKEFLEYNIKSMNEKEKILKYEKKLKKRWNKFIRRMDLKKYEEGIRV